MQGLVRKAEQKKRIHNIHHSHSIYLINLGCAPVLISEQLAHEKIQKYCNEFSYRFSHILPPIPSLLHSTYDYQKKQFSTLILIKHHITWTKTKSGII